jgi:A/G-specific adenine glycosylase
MLQQTRVSAVLPYYERFIQRFPDAGALAEATEEEVLATWSGLGYYRRARSLQAAARRVVEQHDGALPRDVDSLRALPGVGRYTAGAIASIAFDLREPVLDGNVRRVLCRILAGDADEERLWDVARKLVDGPRPGDLNQALMELGALVCTPRRPSCERCPLEAPCRARREGRPEDYPRRQKRRATETVRVAVAVVLRGERVLLERPGNTSPLSGAWDLPARRIPAGWTPERVVRKFLFREHGLEARVKQELRDALSHGIMHRRLSFSVCISVLRRGRVSGEPDLRWLVPAELEQAAVSGATGKVLRYVAAAG